MLGIATLLMALSRNLGVVARALPLDYDLFFTNFFLPTLYYWLALLSAPLWFSLLSRTERPGGGARAERHSVPPARPAHRQLEHRSPRSGRRP